ncbi:MAG: copper oxidase, partial [Pedobacter sp.]
MVMYDELNNPPAQDHSHHQMPKTDKADSTQAENMIDMQGVSAGTGDLVTLNYAMLKSSDKTVLPTAPTKELFFTLTGNMNRYVWSINNKVVREWDKIMIEKGHNVRIVLFNNSMMRHPMHLHGHDFRVINGQGENAPFKNVLDIMPMETDTIEFAGSQDGDWFFHCHILYHMMAGMGNVFSYKNSLPNPELPDKALSG